MYRKIDEFYKKNSLYKKIKFCTLILAFLVTLLLSAFSSIQYYFIPFILIMFLAIIIMKMMYEIILDEKLHFYLKKVDSSLSLDNLINEKEKKMFVKYLKDNNLYNENSIKCILDHYRCFIKTKVVNSNLLAILSIITPIILAFVTKEGFDIDSFSASLPYILSLILTFILLYFSINGVIAINKFFTGKDGLEERLESVFSEIYIEYEEIFSVNNHSKTKNTKSKK